MIYIAATDDRIQQYSFDSESEMFEYFEDVLEEECETHINSRGRQEILGADGQVVARIVRITNEATEDDMEDT